MSESQKKINTKRDNFNHLLSLVGEHWRHIVFGLCALVVVDSLNVIVPLISRYIIDELTDGLPTIQRLVFCGIAIVILAILMAFARFTWRYYIAGSAHKIERDLRQRLYEHLQTLSPQFYDKSKVGDIMAYMTNDIQAIRMATGIATLAAVDSLIMGSVIVMILFMINLKLALWVLIPAPFLTIVMLKFGKLIHARFNIVQESFSSLTDKATESLAGIRVTKAYGDEESESHYFKEQAKICAKEKIHLAKIDGIFEPLIHSLAAVSLAILLYVGGGMVIQGEITIGDLFAFSMFINMMIWPMMAIGWVVNLIQRGLASMNRIQSIFANKPDIKDGNNNHQPKPIIEVKNLSFTYPGSDKRVLNNINFKLQSNQTLGIVGNTGAGKTTIIELLMRLYNPPAESIFLDGHDITTLKTDKVRNLFGYVPQETFLFALNVAENIAFGNDKMNQEEIEKMATIANIHEDIKDFSDGYETTVGERGVTLSGGQKQRIAIARALSRTPQILVFDDSLSSVDTETEAIILQNIESQIQQSTTILIAHRISTVKNADLILVLHDGNLIESGKHDDLMKKNGRYREFHDLQQLEEQQDNKLEGQENE